MPRNSVLYQRSGEEGVLTLSGVVDIFEAETLHGAALQAVEDWEAGSVRADLSQATRLDISALQILCAFRRGLEESGRALVFHEAGAELIEAAANLGIHLFTA